MTLVITREDDAAPETRAAIRDRLNAFNVAVTGRPDWSDVTIVLRDDGGTVRGGVLGEIWASWLHVEILWVDEALRRQGWGTRLLAAAEACARERGCTHAHLDTFSFQAGPRFYTRLGYQTFGVLPDHPAGHTQHFLTKRL
jgi:GNAT superfamily N-acetyltransferase